MCPRCANKDFLSCRLCRPLFAVILSFPHFSDIADLGSYKLSLVSSKRAFEKDLRAIEDLRNKVAHAGNYAHNDEEMGKFIQQVLLTQRRISELESFINAAQKS